MVHQHRQMAALPPNTQTYQPTCTGGSPGLPVAVIPRSLRHPCCSACGSQMLSSSFLGSAHILLDYIFQKLPKKDQFLAFLSEAIFFSYPHAGLIMWLSVESSRKIISLRILENCFIIFKLETLILLIFLLLCA